MKQDRRLTVSAHTDGNLYVENRTGASVGFNRMLLHNAQDLGSAS